MSNFESKLDKYLNEAKKPKKLSVKGPPYNFSEMDKIIKYYKEYDITLSKSDFKWIQNRTKDVMSFAKNMMSNVQNNDSTATLTAVNTIQMLLDDIVESFVDKAEKRAKKAMKNQ